MECDSVVEVYYTDSAKRFYALVLHYKDRNILWKVYKISGKNRGFEELPSHINALVYRRDGFVCCPVIETTPGQYRAFLDWEKHMRTAGDAGREQYYNAVKGTHADAERRGGPYE